MPALRHPVLYLACALLAGAGLAAQAAPAPKDKEPAPATTKKKSALPKFIPSPSQETPRERERRLLRECKGRPNAGSCAGFAN